MEASGSNVNASRKISAAEDVDIKNNLILNIKKKLNTTEMSPPRISFGTNDNEVVPNQNISDLSKRRSAMPKIGSLIKNLTKLKNFSSDRQNKTKIKTFLKKDNHNMKDHLELLNMDVNNSEIKELETVAKNKKMKNKELIKDIENIENLLKKMKVKEKNLIHQQKIKKTTSRKSALSNFINLLGGKEKIFRFKKKITGKEYHNIEQLKKNQEKELNKKKKKQVIEDLIKQNMEKKALELRLKKALNNYERKMKTTYINEHSEITIGIPINDKKPISKNLSLKPKKKKSKLNKSLSMNKKPKLYLKKNNLKKTNKTISKKKKKSGLENKKKKLLEFSNILKKKEKSNNPKKNSSLSRNKKKKLKSFSKTGHLNFPKSKSKNKIKIKKIASSLNTSLQNKKINSFHEDKNKESILLRRFQNTNNSQNNYLNKDSSEKFNESNFK